MKSQQQEETAQHLVVNANPTKWQNPGAVERPENGGEKTGPPQSSQSGADGGHQRQIGKLCGEDDNLEGERIQPEQAEPGQEERALAQGAYGPLRLRREDRNQKIVEVLDVEAGSQPREIVGTKPRGEAAPVKREAEQRGNQPIGGARQLDGARRLRRTHLLSRPTFNTMIPSSRISAPLGAIALSNWKSTRSESPVSRVAGISRT